MGRGECRHMKSSRNYVISVHRHGLHTNVFMEESLSVRMAIAYFFLLRAAVGVRMCTTEATTATTGLVLSTRTAAATRGASASTMAACLRTAPSQLRVFGSPCLRTIGEFISPFKII